VAPKVRLDGNWYYYERGTYQYHKPKAITEQVTVGEKLAREEGGFDAKIWRMNLVLTSRTELTNLSGSFIKTTPVAGSSTSNDLIFADNQSYSHYVYFKEMGPIEAIDRAAKTFRVPILLTESWS